MHIIIELGESRATIVSRDFHSVLILGNWPIPLGNGPI